MGILRRNRTLFSWIAAIALAGNMIASALCCAPSVKSGSALVPDLFGAIVVCTADGLKSFVPGDSTDHRGSGNAKSHCPQCVMAAAFALLFVAALLGLLVARLSIVVLPPFRLRLTFEDLFPSGPSSRGPPRLA